MSSADVRRGSAGRVVNRKVFQRGRREGNIKLTYTWDERSQLGSGTFGKVFRAKSLHDAKRIVAVKQINKSDCDDLDELWKEIGLLDEIDHPHVLRFLEAFEDYRHIYVVTEICMGGDVLRFLEHICGDIIFASRLTAEVLSALAFCHSRGVCHRDLKLDNILLLRASKDSPLRVADFGLASQVQEAMNKEEVMKAHDYASKFMRKFESVESQIGRRGSPILDLPSSRRAVRLKSFKGTPEYMAPEVVAVLNAKVNFTGRQAFYDFRCDVWSLGVCVYAALLGKEPYTLEEVAAYVEHGTELPKSDGRVGDAEAEAFLKRCLVPNYEQRPNSQELMVNEPWLRRFERKNEQLGSTPRALQMVQERLHNFTELSHFKRATLTAAARHLSPLEQEELRCLFESIDTGHSGTITLQELRNALQPNTKAEQDWIIRAFAAMDTDISGEVDYTEFLAAVMDSRIENRRDLAWAAFRAFDLDGSGMISRHELVKVLEDAELQQLLEQVALDSVRREKSMKSPETEDLTFGIIPSPDGLGRGRDRSSLQSVQSLISEAEQLLNAQLAPTEPTSPTSPSLRQLTHLRFDSQGVDGIMKAADLNGDGEISFEEFVRLLQIDYM